MVVLVVSGRGLTGSCVRRTVTAVLRPLSAALAAMRASDGAAASVAITETPERAELRLGLGLGLALVAITRTSERPPEPRLNAAASAAAPTPLPSSITETVRLDGLLTWCPGLA